MTIKFSGEIHEFSMNTAYFTVTPEEYFFICDIELDAIWWKETLREKVTEKLKELGGGIIWWRIETETDHAKLGIGDKDPKFMTESEKKRADEYICWQGYARFATSPELPEDFRTTLGISYDEFKKTMRAKRYAYAPEFYGTPTETA